MFYRDINPYTFRNGSEYQMSSMLNKKKHSYVDSDQIFNKNANVEILNKMSIVEK